MVRRAVFMILFVCIAAPSFAADQKAKADDDPIGRKLSERIGPFVQRDPLNPARGKDEFEEWDKKYERLTTDEKIRYCIFQLREESWWWDLDDIRGDWQYSQKPEGTASRELIKFGRAAMPQLIRALECRATTEIRPTSQKLLVNPWLVQDAAIDAIESIACRFFGDDRRLYELSDRDENERRKVCQRVVDWWEHNKDQDEAQWAKAVLLSEKAVAGGNRWMAIDSLYRRLGKNSYPLLARAYHRLPESREELDGFDGTRFVKMEILHWLLKSPTVNERLVFVRAVDDVPLGVRISGARGLWAVGDSSGLEKMATAVQERIVKTPGSPSLDHEYDNLLSFLESCNTPRSHETVCKCLQGRNPYLRGKAIHLVPSLRIEEEARALPALFDDTFVLVSTFMEMRDDGTFKTIPARRVCDEAAETFNKVVPDAPRFDGSTTETQQRSIEKMQQWWKANAAEVKWDDKQGVMVLPKKG